MKVILRDQDHAKNVILKIKIKMFQDLDLQEYIIWSSSSRSCRSPFRTNKSLWLLLARYNLVLIWKEGILVSIDAKINHNHRPSNLFKCHIQRIIVVFYRLFVCSIDRINQVSCVCLPRQHRTPLLAVLFPSL